MVENHEEIRRPHTCQVVISDGAGISTLAHLLASLPLSIFIDFISFELNTIPEDMPASAKSRGGCARCKEKRVR